LWDVASGREEANIDGNAMRGPVAFSPDGKTLAVVTQGKAVAGESLFRNDVLLWDVAAGRERAKLEGHRGSIPRLAFSPDGRTLAAESQLDFCIRLWDVTAGRESARLEGLEDHGFAVAFSPAGRTVATGGRTVRLWDAATGAVKAKIDQKEDRASVLRFSPDGTTVAWGGAFGSVRVWDSTAGKERARLRGNAPIMFTVISTVHTVLVAFSPDFKVVARGFPTGVVEIWNLSDEGTPK
jgi:WD40 repeat protein